MTLVWQKMMVSHLSRMSSTLILDRQCERSPRKTKTWKINPKKKQKCLSVREIFIKYSNMLSTNRSAKQKENGVVATKFFQFFSKEKLREKNGSKPKCYKEKMRTNQISSSSMTTIDKSMHESEWSVTKTGKFLKILKIFYNFHIAILTYVDPCHISN